MLSYDCIWSEHIKLRNKCRQLSHHMAPPKVDTRWRLQKLNLGFGVDGETVASEKEASEK